jgi:hypothetical protein
MEQCQKNGTMSKIEQTNKETKKKGEVRGRPSWRGRCNRTVLSRLRASSTHSTMALAYRVEYTDSIVKQATGSKINTSTPWKELLCIVGRYGAFRKQLYFACRMFPFCIVLNRWSVAGD